MTTKMKVEVNALEALTQKLEAMKAEMEAKKAEIKEQMDALKSEAKKLREEEKAAKAEAKELEAKERSAKLKEAMANGVIEAKVNKTEKIREMLLKDMTIDMMVEETGWNRKSILDRVWLIEKKLGIR